MRSRLGALVPLLALVTLVVVAPACGGKPQISFDIEIPNDVVQNTAWFEIAAYRDASCAAVDPMLLDGVPGSANARVAFERSAPNPPSLGDLDRGSYAFAAVAKNDACGVLATGCVEVNVDKARSVSISLKATETTTGACTTGAICARGRCVPANDNKNPSVGTQCSLELLGAGPLANPVSGAGTIVSAPAIAATPSGFVIVYREVDSSGSNVRITALPVDSAGGALDPTRSPPLNGSCGSSDESDGVGLVMNGPAGQIVLARPACGGAARLELFNLQSSTAAADRGRVTLDLKLKQLPVPGAQKVTLAAAHVAARGVVAFTADGAGRVATIPPPGADFPGVGGTFGGTANMTGAWVAASDQVLALLAAGPPLGAPPAVDAGDDSGTPAPGGDTSPQLSLVMVPVNTPPEQFSALDNKPRAPFPFPGAWGAVAASGARVIVVSDGGGPEGSSVSFRTFDLTRAPTDESNSFSVEGAGAVATADVTMRDDKAYFAVLKPGGVSLHVFAGAATTPRRLREVTFGKEPRIPSLLNVRDTGRVAVAATATRVAVVWTTAKKLTGNDATGGYAVFACSL